MRLKKLILVAVLAVFAASVACADTINLTSGNLADNGWKTTATFVWGGSTDASVTESTDYNAGSFKFYTGTMPNSWEFQWAGISTNAFAGIKLSDITSVKIRNFGIAGDNQYNWQPPTFTWIVDKGDTNQRCITWKPWTNGNARVAGQWNEYDAAETGQWYVEETMTAYNSLAALKKALPDAFFESSADLPLDWGYASQHAFNVGNCPLYDVDRALFSGTAGYVDWFEIGIKDNVTRYDLGAPVPEPGSILALMTGLIGIVGLRKRTAK